MASPEQEPKRDAWRWVAIGVIALILLDVAIHSINAAIAETSTATV